MSLIDLGSANGTHLNGRRLVLPARLRGGDTLRLGSTLFRLVEENPPASTPAPLPEEDTTLIDLERRDVSVLVTDVRGYTRLSEQLPGEQLSQLIGRWFRTAADIVRAHDGVVDHFIGDGLMALWLADPRDPSRQVANAVAAGVALYRASLEIGRTFATERPDLEFRVGTGINTGHAVLGNIGEDGRRDFTATGDTVNVAFRVEPLTKVYPYPILVTGETECHVRDLHAFTPLGSVDLSGRSVPVPIFGLTPAARA